MLPIPLDFLTELLIRETDTALTLAVRKDRISGFAYVFEVGQPSPCFYLAIDTGRSPSHPSTGEWTYPAGGFLGADMSGEWYRNYALLDAYMAGDGDGETRLNEVHTFLRSVMKQVRRRWASRLPQCGFTVNECDDSDAIVEATYTEINERN